MATQAVTSGAAKHDGGVVLFGGNVVSSRITNKNHESAVRQTNLPVNSTTVGTKKAISGNPFAYHTPRVDTLAYGSNQKVGGTASTLLTSPASKIAGAPPVACANGFYQYDRSSWDYVTGAVTLGGSEGTLFTFIDAANGGAIAREPFPTNAVPGELVYADGSLNPVQKDYQPRYYT